MDEQTLGNLSSAGLGHPMVRRFFRLKSARYESPQPEDGFAVAIEGLWLLDHAVSGRAAIEALFVCEDLLRGPVGAGLALRLARRGTAVYTVSEKLLRKMADRKGPDGLAGIAHLKRYALADLEIYDNTRLVVADGSASPGNLGTIIRTADGAGATAVIVTSSPLRASHPSVTRASMGTVFGLPVLTTTRDKALSFLRSCGVRIVAAEPTAQLSYAYADLSGPVALVLGGERRGLDGFWRQAADVLVSLPMLGVADSLNVGHVAAVLLYEALAQNRHKRGGPSR